MNQQGKNALLAFIACLLLLVAGSRFWSMAVVANHRAELSSHSSQIQQRIVSHVDPQGAGPQRPNPFADLNLTEDQRRKIDDILDANIPKLPPPGKGGPVRFRIKLPMDKISKVLTAEQMQKFDRMHHGIKGAGPGLPGGEANPDSPGPHMFIMHQGQLDASP